MAAQAFFNPAAAVLQSQKSTRSTNLLYFQQLRNRKTHMSSHRHRQNCLSHRNPFALSMLIAALFAAEPVTGFAQTTLPVQLTSAVQPTTSVTLSSITLSDQAKPALAGSGVDVSAVPALNTLALQDRLKDYLGKPLTQPELLEILGAINAQLVLAGDSFAVASLPEQDLTAGKLAVLVIRSRVGQITIKNVGADTFSEARYRSLISVKPGDLLRQDVLDSNIDWIARSNGYRSASIITEAGKEPGQTDLSFMVNDRKPFSFSTGYDNNGTRTTGRDRVTLSAGWGNVFGLDHQASYSLNANPQSGRYVAHGLGYVVPLPWRHVLSLSANLANIKSDLGAPFDSKGSNLNLSARYDVPLKNQRNYKHGMSAGLDYKRSNNNLLFNLLPVTNTETDIFQFNLGYNGTLQDSFGQTSLSLNWTHSPGGYNGRNNDATFSQSRFNAKARYNYQTLSLERTTRLPHNWNWTVSGRFQFADSNLLGSEQLSAGGVSTVRGFAEPVASGDKGYVLRSEVVSPFKELGSGTHLTRVQGLVFVDHARVGNKNLLPGETTSNALSSVGVGARLAFPRNVSLRIDAGKQLGVNVQGFRPQYLVHVSLSVSM
jgi:hemolysin activation/secretion protein